MRSAKRRTPVAVRGESTCALPAAGSRASLREDVGRVAARAASGPPPGVARCAGSGDEVGRAAEARPAAAIAAPPRTSAIGRRCTMPTGGGTAAVRAPDLSFGRCAPSEGVDSRAFVSCGTALLGRDSPLEATISAVLDFVATRLAARPNAVSDRSTSGIGAGAPTRRCESMDANADEETGIALASGFPSAMRRRSVAIAAVRANAFAIAVGFAAAGIPVGVGATDVVLDATTAAGVRSPADRARAPSTAERPLRSGTSEGAAWLVPTTCRLKDFDASGVAAGIASLPLAAAVVPLAPDRSIRRRTTAIVRSEAVECVARRDRCRTIRCSDRRSKLLPSIASPPASFRSTRYTGRSAGTEAWVTSCFGACVG